MRISDWSSDVCSSDLALTDLGQPYRINSRLVRGIDYYTSTVFEWTTTALGAQGTVLAGGRYDGLVEQLGGSPTPAVGWACGIERLLLLMKAQAVAIDSGAADVYFCWLGDTAQREARRLAEPLREAAPPLPLVLPPRGGQQATHPKNMAEPRGGNEGRIPGRSR